MNFENITFTVEAGIARLTLNQFRDPLTALPAPAPTAYRALDAIQAAIASIRGKLVLTGAGRALLAAGQDLADPMMAGVDGNIGYRHVVERKYKPLVPGLQPTQPTIAAVNVVLLPRQRLVAAGRSGRH